MIYLGINLKGVMIILIIVLLLTAMVSLAFRNKEKWYIFAGIYLFSLSGLIVVYKSFMIKILLWIGLPSLLLGAMLGLLLVPEKIDELWDIEFLTNKGKKIIKNVKRGVLIFGSAGSGKTESPIYVLLRFFAQKLFTGVVYDYKDGELTEIAKPLFKDRLKIICVHNPRLGGRINPFAEEYIKDIEIDINEVVSVLIMNLSGEGTKTDFFKENATALLSGVFLKLFLEHRRYCTIPHVIALLLAIDLNKKEYEDDVSFKSLRNFLKSNQRASIQASAFLMGLDSERQTAAVLSTLANSLRKLAFPNAFWVLSGNDVKLNVNDQKVNTVLSVINQPKNDNFLTPVVATLIHTATKQMMQRGKLQSFLLLDEAPTIKLLNMAKIPATMRSFGVAVIYCAQDIVQGVVKYTRDGFKEIMANLGTQIFGKANDPDTAKFYEGYFELIEKDQKSISKKGGGGFFDGGTTGTTTSKREVAKIRAQEFMKLKAGEFAFISNGESEMIKFNRLQIEREKLTEDESHSDSDYLSNFNKIISDMEKLIVEYE